MILGPLFNQAVTAVTPIAAAADVRVLAFSNVASAAAPGTYLLGFRPEEQVERVVRYAVENVERRRRSGGRRRGRQRRPPAAALRPRPGPDRRPRARRRLWRDRDGRRCGARCCEAGGELGETLFYPPDLADPSAVVRQIAAYDRRTAALERERARLEAQDDDASAPGAAAPRDASTRWARRRSTRS